jgi:hypothetical protein
MATNQAVSTALSRLGIGAVGAAHIGVWDGYAVTVRHSAPYYYLDFAVRLDRKDRALPKALRAELKNRLPKKLLGCVNNGDHITCTLTVDKKTPYTDQFEAALNAIADALRQKDVAPATTCAVCGREHPDSLCLIDGYQPVHAACVQAVTETTKHAAEADERKERYLTGFIGAVIGAFIGLEPCLLSILLFDRIYTVLFALVPLCAMWGYRRFRGKRSGASIVIIILLSLAGVVLLEFLAVAISFKQELGLTLVPAMRYTLNYLFTRVGVGVMLQESLTELLVMAIGIFVAWAFLAQNNHNPVSQANAVRHSLHPIYGGKDDPEWLEK